MFVDCFMYAGEEDALRIRMHELDDVIDKFIIIEGIKTFRGEPKALYLDRVWDELRPWHDRIHRVIIEHFPETDNPWEMERFHRDQIQRGLHEAEIPHDALVVVADADEIPRASALKKINPWAGVVHLEMNTYYFRLDWKVPDKWNQGGRPFLVVNEQMGSPQEMRDKPKRFALDSAWHFSYLGMTNTVQRKIKSFAHSEYDTPEYTNKLHLMYCAKEGLDPFGRFELEAVEVDETYPQWVQDHRNELKHLSRKTDIFK